MTFWFITATIFAIRSSHFLWRGRSEGWLQFWSGRVRFLFLAIDGITLRWSERALWSLPQCLLWIEIVEFVTRYLTPSTITTEPADFFPKYTKEVLIDRRKQTWVIEISSQNQFKHYGHDRGKLLSFFFFALCIYMSISSKAQQFNFFFNYVLLDEITYLLYKPCRIFYLNFLLE